MPPAARLTLFGPPCLLADGGVPLVFGCERAYQLLAYLACRGAWVSRDEAAEWLWPGRGQASARSNLRKTLLQTRRLSSALAIEQQGDKLRWSPDTDLQAFERACDEQRFEDAIALGAAPLLQGMDAALSVTAADWLAFERERVDARWRSACASRLEALRDDPGAAAELAERILRRDPLDEVAVQALVRARLRLNQLERAAEALAAHARRLHDELGLDLSEPLRALAADVAAATRAPAYGDAALVRPRVAHTQAAGFVGRRMELSLLGRLLGQESCRVLTITGPPGVGKSALARHALSALAGEFAEGGEWVRLEDLTDAAHVPLRVAQALAIEVDGGADPWGQIFDAVGDSARLLVLDNCEHLDISAPLSAFSDACPHTRILATARSRLDVTGEWMCPIEGLPLPDDDETDVEVLRHCDAVALFESRALQRSPSFDLASAAVEVVRLVHLVEGLPLAIELAAAWTHVMPIADIINELRHSIDLLEPVEGTKGERGLRAGFARSWARLSAVEQRALANVSLLPGPFGRHMAQQVASAPLPVLAALVDKSLLRAERDGLFSVHPLLRQCALSHVEDAESGYERHARYVAQWLGHHRDVAQMPLTEIEAELPHLRSALRWAIDHREVGVFSAMAPVLDRFYQQRGLWAEGLAAFRSAAAAFDDGNAAWERALLSALNALANMHSCAGDLLEAERCARRSLRIAQRHGDLSSMKSGLNAIGISLCQRGLFAKARPFFDQALRRASREGDRRALAALLGNLALADEGLGHYERALDSYRQAVALHHEAGRVSGVATNLNNMANLLRLLRRSKEALPLLHEALELCEAHGLHATTPFVLVTLGLAHGDLGEATVAAAWMERALKVSRTHGESNIEATALLGQARLDALAGRSAQARSNVRQALAIAERLRSSRLQIECVIRLGETLAIAGSRLVGAALMRWGSEQSFLFRPDADAAKGLLDVLGFEQRVLDESAKLLPPTATLNEALAVATLNAPAN